jgi:hypothetical protein
MPFMINRGLNLPEIAFVTVAFFGAAFVLPTWLPHNDPLAKAKAIHSLSEADADAAVMAHADNLRACGDISLWRTEHPTSYMEFEEAIAKHTDEHLLASNLIVINDQRTSDYKLFVTYRAGSKTPVITNTYLDVSPKP